MLIMAAVDVYVTCLKPASAEFQQQVIGLPCSQEEHASLARRAEADVERVEPSRIFHLQLHKSVAIKGS